MSPRKKNHPLRTRPRVLLLCMATLLSMAQAHASASAAPPARVIEVVLRPGAADASRNVPFVDVTVTLPGADVAAGQPLLRMSMATSNAKTVATSLHDLHASDADGTLVLSFHDDPPSGDGYRRWTANRAVHGPVKVSYRADITNASNPLGAAPPLELRSESFVFSAETGAYVMMPDAATPYRMDLSWDFSSLDMASIGVSTLGLGHQSSPAMTPDELESIYTMGGRLEHEPALPASDGFFSAWQGQPPFDAHALMQWTHRLYTFYLRFFDEKSRTYTVFLRRNVVNPGGGVSIAHSFVGTFDKGTALDDFKLTIAHEMIHTFVGVLDQEGGVEDSWFAEGLAVYYERVLPYRAHLISREEYVKDINATAARYYTNIMKTTPNEVIPTRFWADTRIRVLPYDRGAFYFAQVNAAIRDASRGKRSLDDVLVPLMKRRDSGHKLTQAAWVDAVTRELGAAGKQQFDDMLAGKLIELDSDAFGPCFQRIQKLMRRYELGFTPDVLTEPTRIVRGVVAGSNAAKAGLRNGDHIIKPVSQDGIQLDQTALLTLGIQRDNKSFDVTYLPRGETVPTWQWVPVDSPVCHSAD